MSMHGLHACHAWLATGGLGFGGLALMPCTASFWTGLPAGACAMQSNGMASKHVRSRYMLCHGCAPHQTLAICSGTARGVSLIRLSTAVPASSHLVGAGCT